jgi:hypothetical protein
MAIDDEIDRIISNDQNQLLQEEKEAMLLPVIKDRVKHSMKHSPHMKSFYEKLEIKPSEIKHISEVPPLPVTMFKQFELRTCEKDAVVRTLTSSATTGIPSKIFLDKGTAFRQTKGLVSTLKGYIGKGRKSLLVIDTEEVNKPGMGAISARGVAIRGVSTFASKIVYVMDGKDDIKLNEKRLENFCQENKGKDILVYGFTYMIWTKFVEELERQGKTLTFPNAKILHSGGWKRLKAKQVEKKEFNKRVSNIFGTSISNIIDFYGMVEQVGVIFPDCEEGRKHVPDFAEVIIRNPLTMEEERDGDPGLIEIMSILPNSYPGEAILTEDQGRIIGIDDCSCARKGKSFEFLSRVEKAELRGCGDTFAERRGDK